MNVPCPAPLVSLVVKWPRALGHDDMVERVARRLGEARVGVTWSLDDPAQAVALVSRGARRRGDDAALTVADAVLALEGVSSPRWTDEIGGRLNDLRAAGLTVETLHAGLDMARSSCQRTLRILGVRAIVTEAASAAPSAARPLPFGIWQFAPRLAVPAARSWTRWLRRRPGLASEHSQASVAVIDLVRLASTAMRGSRELESLLAEVMDLRARGGAEVVCVSEIAGRLAEQNAPRPQRSILRAA